MPKKMFLRLMKTYFKIEILAYRDEDPKEYLQFVVNRYKIWVKSKVGFYCSSLIHIC
jgi:hypothetical protein